MPIVALPDSTSHAIGSSLVLNDASAVIKELVDNALDAGATVIAIEISVNTLDVIQVRDNGFGIGVEDRQLLCRRGYTSKIRSIDDLVALGGSSLGFRGEALASVAELSEAVIFTTRVDGEVVGSTLKYGKAGTLLSATSASHAVGTTVRVQDFLKLIPVRRQTVLKASNKTLVAIKKLLQAYAFARPHVKLTFKVLKGKNDNANWSYTAQCAPEDIQAAAIRIVGRDVSVRCEFRVIHSSYEADQQDTGEGVYSISALLAKIDQDLELINNAGHFVSIDGRPVTTSRGSIKELIKLYKSIFRSAYSHHFCNMTNADPFICLHIRCPTQSYDVNIEPAKDEVLFLNANLVLSLAERLFRDYYGNFTQHTSERTPTSEISGSTLSASRGNFEILLARKPPPRPQLKPLLENPSASFPLSIDDKSPNSPTIEQTGMAEFTATELYQSLESNSTRKSKADSDHATGSGSCECYPNMYAADEDECIPENPVRTVLRDPDLEQNEGDLKSTAITNPWSLARMNAVARPMERRIGNIRDKGDGQQLRSLPLAQSSSPIPKRFANPYGNHRIPLGPNTDLPSPSTSPHSPVPFQNPGPPLRPWRPVERSEVEGVSPSSEGSEPHTPQAEHTNSLLAWVKPVRPTTQLPSFQRFFQDHSRDGGFSQGFNACSHDAAETVTVLHHSASVPDNAATLEMQNSTTVNQPSRSSPNGLSSTVDVSTSQSGDDAAVRSPMPPVSDLANTELAQILDFERRKKAAILRQRILQLRSGNRVNNAARLTQALRRSSYTSVSADEDVSAHAPHLSSGLSNISDDSQAEVEVRFGGALKGKHKSNPHQNRYIAATRSLSQSLLDKDRDERHEADSVLDPRIPERVVRMPDSDPRAYFMMYAQAYGDISKKVGDLTKTGLKIRRVKSSRLPLESIPVNATVHDLVMLVATDICGQVEVESACTRLSSADTYVVSGVGKHIKWEHSSQAVQVWEEKIRMLVKASYRVSFVDDEVVPDIEIDLARHIKAHIDQ